MSRTPSSSWHPASLPFDETERLSALREAQVLDTESEPAFDNIVRLAAAICGVPMAMVSLIDETRQWFKARVGLAAQQTPRDQAFCAHALTGHEAFTVPDAHEDERFANNPLVTGEPGIRFYSGVPLRTTEGSALGTLCVLDRKPRILTPEQDAALKLLADQAASELKLRVELAKRAHDTTATWREGRTWSGRGHASARGDNDDPEAALLISGAPLDRRYRIDRALGRGGMGFVLAAHDLQDERPVAIKFLRRHIEDASEAIARFAREARTLMELQSDHVVRVYDVGNTNDGIPYIVMEHLQGEDLGERLLREATLPVGEVVALALQACDVLAEAHDMGIVHRDLKPGNLFLANHARHGHVLKILDFGIAKMLKNTIVKSPGAAYETDATTVLGSPHYMPPEQMFAEPDLNGQADVWAMGVVMYQALTGRYPFEGETTRDIWHAVLTKDPPPIRSLRADVPPELADVIHGCLRRDRAHRVSDVWQLARELAPLRRAAPAE